MQCQFCKEEIHDEAVICPHCQKDQPVERSRKRGNLLTVLIVIAAIFGVILWIGASYDPARDDCKRALEASGYASGVTVEQCVAASHAAK